VLVPILSFAVGGWMIGWASAPYDPAWAHRYPRREALMAAAGPAANLVLVVLAALAIRLGILAGWFFPPESVSFDQVTGTVLQGGAGEGVVLVLSILFSLNLVLFAFNLLPLPPLDGSAIWPVMLGEDAARRFRQVLAAQPALALAGLLIAWKVFGPLFERLFVLALAILYPGMGYGWS
jgi:Zn-dependent protease